MKIQILGTGCPKCKMLTQNVEDAIKELGIDCHIEKVTDIDAILASGVPLTPALVIDGKVVSYGKVLSSNDAKKFLTRR